MVLLGEAGLQLNIADEILRGMAKACRRSKTLRRLLADGTKNGCNSGEAHSIGDRRCKASDAESLR